MQEVASLHAKDTALQAATAARKAVIARNAEAIVATRVAVERTAREWRADSAALADEIGALAPHFNTLKSQRIKARRLHERDMRNLSISMCACAGCACMHVHKSSTELHGPSSYHSDCPGPSSELPGCGVTCMALSSRGAELLVAMQRQDRGAAEHKAGQGADHPRPGRPVQKVRDGLRAPGHQARHRRVPNPARRPGRLHLWPDCSTDSPALVAQVGSTAGGVGCCGHRSGALPPVLFTGDLLLLHDA